MKKLIETKFRGEIKKSAELEARVSKFQVTTARLSETHLGGWV
jgi:hypothetical protein